MSQQKVRDIFQKNTKIPILKLKKINHFAFVHYESRQAAQTVMDIMTSIFIYSYMIFYYFIHLLFYLIYYNKTPIK